MHNMHEIPVNLFILLLCDLDFKFAAKNFNFFLSRLVFINNHIILLHDKYTYDLLGIIFGPRLYII